MFPVYVKIITGSRQYSDSILTGLKQYAEQILIVLKYTDKDVVKISCRQCFARMKLRMFMGSRAPPL